VAETPYAHFRLRPHTMGDLDALAASAGNRSAALREAVEQWHAAVAEAGRRNADELTREDWDRLAHINHPDPFAGLDGEAERVAPDWSQVIALELVGMWEGRELILPAHREEAALCKRLARRIAGWGRVRGYALFACLRRFWEGEAVAEWWDPAAWMTPDARD
jgi:hypothetical protein